MTQLDSLLIYNNLNIAYGLLIANDEINYEEKRIIADYIEESIHYIENKMLEEI